MEIVRITSGEYRGRTLKTPGGATHPMGAREKLALFNMISGYVPGAVVLDAYAGSGALGIEALSRGAESVVFVEKSPVAASVIKKNLSELGLVAEVATSDVANFQPKEKFDLILADPPYDKFDADKIKDLVKFLTSGGILVLSHPGEAPEIPGLEFLKSRKYAGARISIYKSA